MLKLVLVLVVAALLVSCLGKPSASDTALQNEDVTAFSDKTQEEDSSKSPVENATNVAESRNATIDTYVSPSEDGRTGNNEKVTKAAEETDLNITGNIEAVNGKKNVTVEKKRTSEIGNIDENIKENAVGSSQKRKTDPTKLHNYGEIDQTEKNIRRLLIGFSLDNDEDADQKFNDETRRSNDGASLEQELNIDERIPTRTGNIEENSAELLKLNKKSETDTYEVNFDVISSRNSKVNVVQKNASEIDSHDTSASSETRSANSTTIETTPVLRSAKKNHTAAPVENSKRSGVPGNFGNLVAVHPNVRINREDSARSATASDTESDTYATAKSDNGSVKSAATEIPADESKSSQQLEETNVENRNGKETIATTEYSSNNTLELTPELKTGQKPKINEVVEETDSSGATKRMIADDKHKGGVDSRTGLDVAAVSEVAKEAVSRAGSPADQSRVASSSPLSFPTTVLVPIRRSISTNPSIIITRIPNSDIIKLPHEVGTAAGALVPNNLSRRGVDFTNGLNASENSFTIHGEEKTGESKAKDTDQSTNYEYNSPESVLRVDDHTDDFNHYNLKGNVSSPVANPDVRHDNQKVASHIANEVPDFEHSHRAGDALNSVSETSRNAAVETSNEEARSAVEAPIRNDANSYPLSLQPTNLFPIPKPFEESLPEKHTKFYPIIQQQANHYTSPGTFEEYSPKRFLSDADLYPMSQKPAKPSPESFVPRQPNHTPQAESLLPAVNHYLPEVEYSLKSDSAWPETLVNRLIQATTLVNQRRYPQQNQLGLFYPYNLYYPSTRRY